MSEIGAFSKQAGPSTGVQNVNISFGSGATIQRNSAFDQPAGTVTSTIDFDEFLIEDDTPPSAEGGLSTVFNYTQGSPQTITRGEGHSTPTNTAVTQTNIASNFSAVFNYVQGNMYAASNGDGTTTVYDNTGARAVVKVATPEFVITSFNVSNLPEISEGQVQNTLSNLGF